MNELISVIVPIYKVEAYLDECVQSIVNQTYKNLEIILVDDGSTDNCPQMCDDWAIRDSRIKVIHKKNAGAAAARNSALDIAKGDYFGFVDSDDYIADNMFEELLKALLDSGKKISYCTAYRVLPNGTALPTIYSSSEGILNVTESINEVFYWRIDTAVWSKLFERSVFDGIRFPEGETNEEFPILLPLISNAGGIINTGKTLYYYRAREGSVTASCYMRESSSGLVYKNLNIIKAQLKELNLPCKKAYRLFAAGCAFSSALSMEKHYKNLSPKIRKDCSVYRKIMGKYFFNYIISNRIKIKDKLLYVMVLTKLLRPLYKMFYKNHL